MEEVGGNGGGGGGKGGEGGGWGGGGGRRMTALEKNDVSLSCSVELLWYARYR